MSKKPLTIKQENFCQAYVRLGDKSAAYREAYNAVKMKPETVNNNAYMLFDNSDITARIEVLQKEARVRNAVTLDEVVGVLANMLRFDMADLYNADGSLKPIHDMPKEARLMIHELESDELFSGYGKEREMIGYSKKVKTYSKSDAIEKLMKHLGGYEKDNAQSKPEVNVSNSVDISKLSTEALAELKAAQSK